MKYRRENGECPVDDFLGSKALIARDRSKIDSRVLSIQQIDQPNLPSGWVVRYQTTQLERLERKAENKKAIRFLCESNKRKKTIILFNATIKKDKNLPASMVGEAIQLQSEYRKGKGSVEDYSFD